MDLELTRAAIESWYWAGIAAVDPFVATKQAITIADGRLIVSSQGFALPANGRIVAIAVGKAAAPMANALDEVLGERITAGIVLTKDGHLNGAPERWDLYEASHPVPDERGVEATRKIIEAVTQMGKDDLAIVLVSGGGSALLEAPKATLELADIQRVTDLLLRAGAPIQDLNAVRRELSDVKGGGLRRHIGEAACITLILSDVLGNDPTVIASGPTVTRDPDPAKALELIQGYGIEEQVPLTLIQVLQRPSPNPHGQTAATDVFEVVGDNSAFVAAVAAAAERDGLQVRVLMSAAEGEARALADRFLDLVTHQPDDVDVVIGGGEATVTVRGDGVGGRNTEFALASATRLTEESIPWVIASLASDGQDGAIDAAGAIVDLETWHRGLAQGKSATAFLDKNDSGTYLRATGDLLVTGPTGTNVNDVYIAVRQRELASA